MALTSRWSESGKKGLPDKPSHTKTFWGHIPENVEYGLLKERKERK